MLNMFRKSSLRRNVRNIVKNFATEATFQAHPFDLHLLKDGPSPTLSLSKENVIQIISQMEYIRKIEIAADALYKKKLIRGFCHLYNGQEACAVGVKAAMRPDDMAITAYRAHGWCFVMGLSPYEILAELVGSSGGCSRGKGGSMHMYANNFFGGNGIVGAQVPMGTGAALACKYKGNNAVSFVAYGDGASNQGQVFESYNIACLWKLPVIYLCENNQYGMGTQISRSACNTNFYKRGDIIPGIRVDGMDVVSVISAARFAICSALECGPIILELNTYRYHGHSMSDPGTSYRSRDEVDVMRKSRDPITTFRKKVVDSKLVTEDELNELEKKAKDDVAQAVEKAINDKVIPLEELCADIYSHNLHPKIRGVTDWNFKHIKKNVGTNEDGENAKKSTPSQTESKTSDKCTLTSKAGTSTETSANSKSQSTQVTTPEKSDKKEKK